MASRSMRNFLLILIPCLWIASSSTSRADSVPRLPSRVGWAGLAWVGGLLTGTGIAVTGLAGLCVAGGRTDFTPACITGTIVPGVAALLIPGAAMLAVGAKRASRPLEPPAVIDPALRPRLEVLQKRARGVAIAGGVLAGTALIMQVVGGSLLGSYDYLTDRTIVQAGSSALLFSVIPLVVGTGMLSLGLAWHRDQTFWLQQLDARSVPRAKPLELAAAPVLGPGMMGISFVGRL